MSEKNFLVEPDLVKYVGTARCVTEEAGEAGCVANEDLKVPVCPKTDTGEGVDTMFRDKYNAGLGIGPAGPAVSTPPVPKIINMAGSRITLCGPRTGDFVVPPVFRMDLVEKGDDFDELEGRLSKKFPKTLESESKLKPVAEALREAVRVFGWSYYVNLDRTLDKTYDVFQDLSRTNLGDCEDFTCVRRPAPPSTRTRRVSF